jgi:hypothetical protein
MNTAVKIKRYEAHEIALGEVRRFGPDGVLYEIKRKAPDGRLLICVLDTGEETFYPLAKALEDPRG